MKIIDINGIGPAIATKLEADNVTLEVIAAWTDDDINDADEKYNLKQAARRDDWRGQAVELLANNARVSNPDVAAKAAAHVAALQAEAEAAKPAPVAPAAPVAPVAPAAPKARKRRKLNRNTQKYADIVGRYFNAMYSANLDGKEVYFDHEGVEILFDDKGQPIEDDNAEVAEQSETTADNIRMMNWLDGKTDPDLSFAKVRKAIKEKYNRDFKDEKSAKQFLHETYRVTR